MWIMIYLLLKQKEEKIYFWIFWKNLIKMNKKSLIFNKYEKKDIYNSF